MAEVATIPNEPLTYDEVAETFHEHLATEAGVVPFGRFGEDGDGDGVALAHLGEEDIRAFAAALLLDVSADGWPQERSAFTHEWMLATLHELGCDGYTDTTCAKCKAAEHGACADSRETRCDCSDYGHARRVICGCDQYAWLANFVDEGTLGALAVTRWAEFPMVQPQPQVQQRNGGGACMEA